MTAEQRKKELKELATKQLEIRDKMRALESDQRHEDQQDCLQWVGRAFKNSSMALLITSVPPIQMDMLHDYFDKTKFPCITVKLKGYTPPSFDEICFIKDEECIGPSFAAGEYKEIPFKQFQDILTQRVNDILKLAATAKMRQQGKEVWDCGRGEICEK